MRYRWVSDIPLIEVISSRDGTLQRPAKRLLDLVVGGLLLLLALPAMLLCAVLIPLLSRGPVLYRQVRIGRDRKPFTLLKFRTMVPDAEAGRGEVLATANDPRLIPFGGWMRRTRLDELPQLLNVLGGSMSLVGPRPERPGFVEEFLDKIPGYAERFSMLPGLTGLAQVNGEYDSTADNKLRYDMAYHANSSFWLDLSILVRTVRTVLTSRGV
jgi:exopolysaccharide biosynthesis polyprenyl glycosylphosphotransferase